MSDFVIIPGISEANGYTTGTTLNSCGTADVHNPNLTYGSMTDQEGNVYKTIEIGTQVWMAENLNTSIYRNGDAIPTNLNNATWDNTTSGAWSYYNNEASYACPYGKLYNWFACVDARHLCPVGWHVPNDAEWTVLTTFLGNAGIAGGKMKSTGTIESGTGLWYLPNTGSTNSSGFSGIPGGGRFGVGTYYDLGYVGHWWSSSVAGNGYGWDRSLYYIFSETARNEYVKQFGFSVRCLRD
jgi:uncharacterized protein (TIGR02145 family)